MRGKVYIPAGKSSVVGSKKKTSKVLSSSIRTNKGKEGEPSRGSLLSQEETGYGKIIPISFPSGCFWCGVVLTMMMTRNSDYQT